ncbi:MAG: cache domain-containing protein [bacterium]|nr:cache domain-containing protein [bacterium]
MRLTIKHKVMMMVGLATVSTGLAVNLLFSYGVYQDSQRGLEEYRHQLEVDKKDALKTYAQIALKAIEPIYQRSKPENIGNLLEDRSHDFKSLLQYLAAHSQGKETQKAVQQLIQEYRYGGGNYFWAQKGTRMILHPTNPSLNGRDLSDQVDSKGKAFFAEIAGALASQDQATVSYYWKNPRTGQEELKVSRVFLFKPLGWIIGTGAFYSDLQEQLKTEAAQIVGNLRYGDSGYFWINDYQPRMVMHPANPKLNGADLSQNQDPNGVFLFNEMVQVVKQAGEGYVKYHWAKPGFDAPQPKISYVVGFKDWSWIIGTGVYVEEIDRFVAEEAQKTRAALVAMVLWSGLATLAVLAVLAALFLWLIHRQINLPLLRIARDVGGASDQVLVASEAIADAADHLASYSSEQAASLEEISSTLSQVSAQTHSNADAARDGAGQMQKVLEEVAAVVQGAQEAASLSAETRGASTQGVSSMDEISTAMNDIQSSSEEITGIIEVLSEITHNTKILATNAAIEAARAGEEGKGFAVVADEVSQLAENSKTSAKEIAQLIKTANLKTRSGSELAQKGAKVLQKIEAQAEQLSSLMERLAQASRGEEELIHQMAQRMDEIVVASSEQAEGLTQVAKSVAEIDEATQASSATAEESASASKELAAQARALADMVEDFSLLIGVRLDTSLYKGPVVSLRDAKRL